jgi:hypothetical protein
MRPSSGAISSNSGCFNLTLSDKIYTAAKEIEAAGGRALPLAVDIREEDAVLAHFWRRTRSNFGNPCHIV